MNTDRDNFDNDEPGKQQASKSLDDFTSTDIFAAFAASGLLAKYGLKNRSDSLFVEDLPIEELAKNAFLVANALEKERD